MRIPRSRGAVSGVMLIVLGAWGALVPLVGPYFDFVIGNDAAWDLTRDRFWLSVLPGAVAVLGGLVLLRSANRATAAAGTWLGLAAGAWFVTGEQFSQLWNDGQSIAGEALGGTGQRVFEQLAYFDGLGVLIIAFSGLALGRLAVRSVRDAELAREAELAERAAEDRDGDDRVHDPDEATRLRDTRESGRFEREAAPVATTSTSTAPPTTDTVSAADRVRAAATENEQRRGFLRGRSDR